MRRQFMGRAYPAHGAVIEDGQGKIMEYIRHRQQREDEVLTVLKHGSLDPSKSKAGENPKSWTAMELVKVIYHDVPENLHEPAEKGVKQVLNKLKGEGKVSQDDSGRWRVGKRSTL
ncbi:Beta-lactamase-like [Lasallia pustulata]|uniref:Beta-lactamase-like n=1 Tax=Lasallia pustulata TaxID=136370 RepID=A0A1W5D698_9LECA|nr:Beta-lactamase-like [Lasallia pustulata]